MLHSGGSLPPIDIFCRVVDNYGDAGVALRLLKGLVAAEHEGTTHAAPAVAAGSKLAGAPIPQHIAESAAHSPPVVLTENGPATENAPTQLPPGRPLIRLFMDKPEVLAALGPLPPVCHPLVSVLPWPPEGMARALEGPTSPGLVIEMFGCGLPADYVAALGEKHQPCVVLNLEYLSAEDWVPEFHTTAGLMPKPWLKRFFFMPGFCPGTGGLIHDPAFMAARSSWRDARRDGRLGEARQSLLAALSPKGSLLPKTSGEPSPSSVQPGGPSPAYIPTARESPAAPLTHDEFWVTVFSYEHPFGALVRDLAHYQSRSGRTVRVLLAAGRGQEPFLEAWRNAACPFPVEALPFLDQDRWDHFLLASDFLIIRGEESLARAVLSGIPFVWHAYLQDRAEHLVKVEALANMVCRQGGAEQEEGLADFVPEPSVPDPALPAGEGPPREPPAPDRTAHAIDGTALAAIRGNTALPAGEGASPGTENALASWRHLLLAFNDRETDSADRDAHDKAARKGGSESWLPVLESLGHLAATFLECAENVESQGDLVANLLTFTRSIGYTDDQNFF